MKHVRTLTTMIALSVTPAVADPGAFRAIVGGAANIERDADAIAALRKDVETMDTNLSNLSPQQKSDWGLIKSKVQLLTIFYDRKAELLSGDLTKNRPMIRAHAEGISKRARMLQQTASRLDR